MALKQAEEEKERPVLGPVGDWLRGLPLVRGGNSGGPEEERGPGEE